MEEKVAVIGAGLAGSEAALALASMGIPVRLYEMRPDKSTPVHKTGAFAELVCSNSLKGMREDSAAGMLKDELSVLGSPLYKMALDSRVAAGGALAVDRIQFSDAVTSAIEQDPLIEVVRSEATTLEEAADGAAAVIVATGPLTSDALSADLIAAFGQEELAFYDAAAPIVMADSLDMDIVFRQSRYEDGGDYLNAPMSKEEYTAFIEALLAADKVIAKDFESKDLFQACQPIEEVARAGFDAPRFGALKPVGLTDPRTGKRPHAVVQLRAEDASSASFNLVGFQTNLTFPAQREVFRMIPGLEQAEFARYGVMHRNTFINAPAVLDAYGKVRKDILDVPVLVAGQLAGTEGYCEAIRSGLNCAISVLAMLKGKDIPPVPKECAFGSLMAYATDESTADYQPMHVNFGIMAPLEQPIRNKRDRYMAYAKRGGEAIRS